MPLRFQDFWCSSTLEREYLRLFLFSVKRRLQFYSHLDSAREGTGEVLLPGKSHGQRSLVSCSPRGRQESGTTERLHFHLSFSYTGEGNGNPLQYSWPGESQGRGAWWAAVYGVAQSWTRLKQLSSSSGSHVVWSVTPPCPPSPTPMNYFEVNSQCSKILSIKS